MTTSPHILILGAGAAGAAAARGLAARNDVRVTLVTQTGEAPYTRMLISGVALGPTPPDLFALPLPQVEVVADTVVDVHPSARTVQLTTGARLPYDALIVATGSRPRTLPAGVMRGATTSTGSRVSTMHSLADAVRIRELLTRGGRPARVAIYGGGLIAAEAASLLHAAGHQVAVISRSHTPGVGAFGALVAERIAADHAATVHTHFGRTVQYVDLSEFGVGITLDDGTPLVADFLLVALGTIAAAPAPWTAGVDVDERLRAEPDRVYAAGGVATLHHESFDPRRIDHWEDAAAQGAHAAKAAVSELGLGEDPGSYLPRSPYMAMIHGRMVSGVGYIGGAESHLEDTDEFVVRHEAGGTVTGVTGIDAVGTVYRWGSQLHGSPA
ncbi:FAD-dependent oxidoreductase [Leucobacter sp. L43]|uniref:FAD-dependent oxidoreductase n=1 Tax=Leucobacter sp. L43 TaxID=2798040 RepID=UPI001905811C|nr:FAD-dependent oxidoreductase [Leucobacter sp. L43]